MQEKFLGKKVKDKLSKVEGHVISYCYNLNEQDSLLIQPECTETNKMPERLWLVVDRAEII